MYSMNYHRAISHLTQFGVDKGDTMRGRRLIAIALKELRRINPAKARRERWHMLFIAGVMPIKKP